MKSGSLSSRCRDIAACEQPAVRTLWDTVGPACCPGSQGGSGWTSQRWVWGRRRAEGEHISEDTGRRLREDRERESQSRPEKRRWSRHLCGTASYVHSRDRTSRRLVRRNTGDSTWSRDSTSQWSRPPRSWRECPGRTWGRVVRKQETLNFGNIFEIVRVELNWFL